MEDEKDLLKELKNKIITFSIKNDDEQSIFILLDYDKRFIKIKNFDNLISLINISKILAIENANEKDKKKFNGYIKKYKKDHNFKGDENSLSSEAKSIFG